MSFQGENMTKKNFVAIFICAVLLAACTHQIPVNNHYSGQIRAIKVQGGGPIALDTKVLNSEGKNLGAAWTTQMNTVLADASIKHGLVVSPANAAPYRLQTTVEALPGKNIWKAVPQKARNFGMAVIPIAGHFTPRYFDISSAFKASFTLYHGETPILTEVVRFDDEEEISVSASQQAVESVERAMRFWEQRRDQSIERFFAALAQKSATLAWSGN